MYRVSNVVCIYIIYYVSTNIVTCMYPSWSICLCIYVAICITYAAAGNIDERLSESEHSSISCSGSKRAHRDRGGMQPIRRPVERQPDLYESIKRQQAGVAYSECLELSRDIRLAKRLNLVFDVVCMYILYV